MPFPEEHAGHAQETQAVDSIGSRARAERVDTHAVRICHNVVEDVGRDVEQIAWVQVDSVQLRPVSRVRPCRAKQGSRRPDDCGRSGWVCKVELGLAGARVAGGVETHARRFVWKSK